MGNERLQVLGLFHPVISEWFDKNIGIPSPPQFEGWPAIKRGENVLITAPTGAGKTLSAFLVCINELFEEGISGTLDDGVQVLYISPLKALNNDIYRNLEVPMEGISGLCSEKGILCPNITKAVRTGDTSSRERQKMLKRPPHILITTPESLYLILTSPNASAMLKNIKYLIIDEIHTLLGSKRGAHLALSVERLQYLTGKPLKRIGLSATVKPMEEAARYLGGFRKVGEIWRPNPVTVIQPLMEKRVDLKITVPVEDYRTLEEGTVWNDIYRRVLEMVKEHKSTLVFVNNRAAAEKVAVNLNKLAEKVIARTHHGCISRESRLEVEKELKSGKLPCLVATSSLELGIDIGAIDLVIQVASPKSVSRGLQRLGRAGHKLNAVSKGRIIPRTRADLLESAIISREMLNGNIEEESVPHCPLDVLSQHIVSMSCVKDWNFDEMLDVVMSAYSYTSIKKEEMENVLSMLSGDYEHSLDSPSTPRVMWDRVNRVVKGTGYSRMLAVGSGGTIPDRGYYSVYLDDGRTRLGELDETFVYEARLGDRFMLGTSAWKIDRIKHDRVIVSPCSPVGAKTPFWNGEGLGRPYELGVRFGAFLSEISVKAGTKEYLPWIMSYAPLDEDGAKNLEQYIMDQKNAAGCLASDKRIVVEYFSDEVGERRAVIHSPFGGRVNCALAIVMEQVLGDALHCQIQASHSDDGVLVNIFGHMEHPKNIFSLLSSDNVESILIDKLPTTPLFSMTFRYNAARALMMGARKIGRRSPLWVQRIKALEVLQIAEKSADHPLIIETLRECMEKILDVTGLIRMLKQIESGTLEVVEHVSMHPSPFTAELLFNFMGVVMYEGQIPKPEKMRPNIISHRGALNLKYPKEMGEKLFDVKTVLDVALRCRALNSERRIQSPDELHAMLLTYGDLKLDETEINNLNLACGGDSLLWLEKLKNEGRVINLEADDNIKGLWVAAEEGIMYSYALGPGQETADKLDEMPWTREEALSRIIRRYARYNSPFAENEISKRYKITASIIQKTLCRLEEDGVLVKGGFTDPNGEEWCHSLVLDRIRKQSIIELRKQIKTGKVQELAAFVPYWQGIGKDTVTPAEDLYGAILKLKGLYQPVEWWEDFIFPARVQNYKNGLLDRLCSSGRVIWRIRPYESVPYLAWFTPEDLEDDVEDSIPEDLTQGETIIYSILKKKGACFFHTLSAMSHMESGELIGILESLLWKGFVVNDSYESVRYFVSRMPSNAKARARMRAAVYKMDMGRWEIPSPLKEPDIKGTINLLLNRYAILTREVLQCEKSRYTWTEVYEILKEMEYLGEVNRGYYIEGLSGMQFMHLKYKTSLPEIPAEYLVIDACDPAQVYGRIAPKEENIGQWSCIPGTAIVLRFGTPVLIIEGYGDRFTSLTDEREHIEEGIKAFTGAFHRGAVWRSRKRINMKQWGNIVPSQCPYVNEISSGGFEREMQYMVLWKKVD